MFHHSFIYGNGSTCILNNGTNVHRDCRRRRNLASDNGIHELLFSALRIFLCQRNDLDIVDTLLLELVCKEFDGSRLIVFNADISLIYLCASHKDFDALNEFIALFHHQSIVGSDIRLTLYAIYNDAFRLCARRRTEFYKSREASTTHTYHSGSLNSVYDFFRSKLRMLLKGFEFCASVNSLFPLVSFYIYNNSRLEVTRSMDCIIYFEYSTRDGTVDWCTDKSACFSDECADFYLITLLYYRLRRSTDVLAHWEYRLLWQWSWLSNGIIAQFILVWMYATNTESLYFHLLSLLCFRFYISIFSSLSLRCFFALWLEWWKRKSAFDCSCRTFAST